MWKHMHTAKPPAPAAHAPTEFNTKPKATFATGLRSVIGEVI